MKKYFWNFNKQSVPARFITITGIVASIYFLLTKMTILSVGTMCLTFIAVVVLIKIENNRIHRDYGRIYYEMTDGEIVEELIDQVTKEIKETKHSRFEGRSVFIIFPFSGRSPYDTLESGFGVDVDLFGYEDVDHVLKNMKRGNVISAKGVFMIDEQQNLYLHQIEFIRKV